MMNLEKLGEYIMQGSNKTKISISIIVIIVVCLLGVFGYSQVSKPEDEKPEVKTSEVNVTLTSQTDNDTVAPASVEILDDENATVLDAELDLGENQGVVDLPEGKYTINMTVAPIETDGSTYKVPQAVDFEVGDNGEVVSVDFELERLAISEMTQEQIAVVITRLENSAHADCENCQELIAKLKDLQEDAVSDPESADDLENESNAEGESDTVVVQPETEKPSTDKPNTSNPGTEKPSQPDVDTDKPVVKPEPEKPTKPDTSKPTEPEKPSHSHKWEEVVIHHPAVAEVTKVVNHPAEVKEHPAVTEQVGYTFFSDGAEVPIETWLNDPYWRDYAAVNGVSFYQDWKTVVIEPAWTETIKPAWSETVVVTPAKPAWTEKTGTYKCSCGATK